MDKRSKGSRAHRLQAVLLALPRYLQKMAPLMLDGDEYTLASLAGYFVEELDTMKEVASLTVARRMAVARERVVKKRNKPLLDAIERLVRVAYGENATVLLAFAMARRSSGQKSAQVKSDAADKARATREAKRAAVTAAKAARPKVRRRTKK